MKCTFCGRNIAGGFSVGGKDSCFQCWDDSERHRWEREKEESIQAQQNLVLKAQKATHCGLCGKKLRNRSMLVVDGKISCWSCYMHSNRQIEAMAASEGIDVDGISRRNTGRGLSESDSIEAKESMANESTPTMKVRGGGSARIQKRG